VRRLLEPVLPAVPVISLSELPSNVTLTTIAVWEMDHES
jgi:flagellar biosynthesis protein FlhA